jgi:hypothetical protein
MRAALRATQCFPALLYLTSEERALDTFDSAYLASQEELLLSRLDHIIELSRQAVSNNEALAAIRIEHAGASVQQSLEARVLWEPIFWFWYEVTGDLGYSDDGPLHRFIERVQLAAGGPPINPETLKP